MAATPSSFGSQSPAHVLRTSLSLAWKVGLVLALLLGLWLERQPLAQFLALIRDREALVRQVHDYGAWGAVVLAFTIALQVTVAVLPGHVLMLASGYLYGAVGGFCITWISTTAASQLNFHLARLAGRNVVNRLAPGGLVDHWQTLAEGKGFTFFFLMFALPIFPGDVMSYVAGFTKISTRRYLAANLLGHLPCAITASLAGAYGLSLHIQAWVGLGALSIIGIALWRHWGRRLLGSPLDQAVEVG